MRILVTGGAGYVGSVSVEHLVASGHEVVVLDTYATAKPGANLAGATIVRGSYADRDAVAAVLRSERIDAVLHCGARSLVGESIQEPALYFQENVAGGISLLQAMRDAGVGRLVISSTAAVYGVPESTPIPEDAPLRPINPYGESKRSFEAAAGWFSTAYGLRVVSLRYFNVAGASATNGERHEPETHLIPNAIRAVAGGAPLTLFGTDYPTQDGTPVRDYVHVLDLAEGHRLALEATADGDTRTGGGLLVCNLGSGTGYSVKEVIAATERVVARKVPLTTGDRRAGDPPTLVADITRAREILRWSPGRSALEEMIGSAWAWWTGARNRATAATTEAPTS
jgi:UDP-glucose 4-epimerase